jgi:hypothetical protein
VYDAPEMLCEFSLAIAQRTKPSATNPHAEHFCSSQSGVERRMVDQVSRRRFSIFFRDFRKFLKLFDLRR